MTKIQSKQEAQAFLAAFKLDEDGLPPAGTADSALADYMTATTLVGKTFDFVAFLSKAKNSVAKSGAPCPIDEATFAARAPELELTMFGTKIKTMKKHGAPRKNPKTGELSGGAFKSGAFGYWFGGQVTLEIDGKPVKFQAGGQLVVVNSGKGSDEPQSS